VDYKDGKLMLHKKWLLSMLFDQEKIFHLMWILPITLPFFMYMFEDRDLFLLDSIRMTITDKWTGFCSIWMPLQ
jgi:hypothetical protein